MFDENKEGGLENYFSFLTNPCSENNERENKTEKKESKKSILNEEFNISKTELLNKKTNREEKKSKKKIIENEHKDKETREHSYGEDNFVDIDNMRFDDERPDFYKDFDLPSVNKDQLSYKESQNYREENFSSEIKMMSLTEVTKDKTKKK